VITINKESALLVPQKKSWKNLAKSVARSLLQKGGGLHDLRYWNRDAFRILMYHDFPASTPGLPDLLAKQCAHLTRYYQVLSMADIARCLRAGKRLPDNAVAVTVDDGNRDFLVNAYPVFRAHQIPVTVFLVSGFLDRKLWLWWDKIDYLVTAAQKPSFVLALSPHLPPEEYTLKTDEERHAAISTIVFALKKHSTPEREEVLRHLSRLLDVEIPAQPPLEMAPMEWSEVRHLADNEMEFGAHTVTHPLLSGIRDTQELIQEIAESKRRMEEELRRPVLHFCYPYGYWDDFNDQTIKVVEACQFHTAVTAEYGLNYRASNPFKLRRISVEPTTSLWYFQELLAGLHLKSHEEEPTPFA
jgi:peptidoglycan/xylan/chitin deacetylase (PgdA/CDA1 family)